MAIEEIAIAAASVAVGFIIGYLANRNDDGLIDKLYKIAQAERMMQATRLGIATEAKVESKP